MRYKSILASKIEEEEKLNLKQEKLKEQNGIEEDVTIKKRTAGHLLKGIGFGVLTIIRFALCAIGILTLIDPALREAFISSIQNII